MHWNTCGWDETITKTTEHVCGHQIVGSIGSTPHLLVFHRRKEKCERWIDNRKIEPDFRHSFIEKLRQHRSRTVERIFGGKSPPGWLHGAARAPLFQRHPRPIVQASRELV